MTHKNIYTYHLNKLYHLLDRLCKTKNIVWELGKRKDLNLDSSDGNDRKYQPNYMSKSKRKNIGIGRDFIESMKKKC